MTMMKDEMLKLQAELLTKAWVFRDSGEAYDAVQSNENIQDGDILLVPSEKVMGVAETWPIAVTLEFGKLHTVNDNGWERTSEVVGGAEKIKKAVALAESLGWPVNQLAPRW